jgi:hypothetical protein
MSEMNEMSRIYWSSSGGTIRFDRIGKSVH